MTVQDYIARQTVRMAEGLAHFLETTAEDRRGWKPEMEGSASTRSPFEQVGECVNVNRMMAKMLRGEELPTTYAGGLEGAEFASLEDAKIQLLASAQELAEAIRALSDADLAREYRHPRALMRGENVIVMPMRNMAYHAGQINLIQMLAGDAEFHVPSNWR